MREAYPKAFLIAYSQVDQPMLAEALEYMGAGDWSSKKATDSSSLLTEIMGRLCYRSWKPGLNPNVTKVREGNDAYLKNILGTKHGSVLEHASASFLLLNVSRVVTHEIVRHRAGCAYSQESLRFVRLEDIKVWYPEAFEDRNLSDRQRANMRSLFYEVVEMCERFQKDAAAILELDSPDMPFAKKKKYTSAMRRGAPIGTATNLGMTANHRAWRHMIAMRTSVSAEEEIRLVFDQIATILKNRFPNLYQDMEKMGNGEWLFENEKV